MTAGREASGAEGGFGPPGGPHDGVVGIETSAGACLVKTGDAPCSLCLEARLVEAGFEMESPIFTVDTASLQPEVLEALDRVEPDLAPVLRVAGEEATWHPLLRAPGCPRCGGDPVASRERPLPSALLRDPLTGITSAIDVYDAGADASLLWSAVIGRVHMPLEDEPEVARGHGPDLAAAFEVQLGEAVERYAALHPVAGRLVREKGSALAGLTPPLDLFCGFDERQCELTGYRPIDPEAEIGWIEGAAIASGGRRFVPAASVFHTRSWNRVEPRYAPMLSSGLASHRTLASARQRALLETLERFRVVEAWHRRSFGPLLDPALLPERLSPLLERLPGAGLTLTLRGLALPPKVPAVLAVVTGDVFPWVAVGFAARLDVAEAAAGATVEAALLWQWMVSHDVETPLGETPSLLARPDAHTNYFATRTRARELVQELAPDLPVSRPEAPGVPVAALESELLSLAPDSVAVVLTPPDCAACGFEVVRIVAPGLPLLSFGSVGTPRLHAARQGLPESRDIHPFG
ncbi:MAG: YcaO-like family protein [Holophagales bacterium]|nr:YcaO-like family protein [Holophagales bacterium]